MGKKSSAMEMLVARVSTWCGIRVDLPKAGVATILLKDKPIARFPSSDTLEASLCGSIQKQVKNEPTALPQGVWADGGDTSRILIDLTQPGGLEEAVRVLLNTYIVSQSPEARGWWMDPKHLNEDPTCEKIADVIRVHRERQHAQTTSAAAAG